MKKENGFQLSRRSFLKLSALAASTAALPLTGCTPSSGVEETTTQTTAASETEVNVDHEEVPAYLASDAGEWRNAGCTSYVCGSGRCVNRVLVKDNLILRQKTDDETVEDGVNFQMRGCLRGRAQRKTVMGVDRLKYPMKRKHWEPGGGQKELRGIDEWERISWDEALDYVADEFNRIKNEYGNEALATTWSFGYPELLNAFGGMHRFWGPISLGAWSYAIPKLTGLPSMTLYVGTPASMFSRNRAIRPWGSTM